MPHVTYFLCLSILINPDISGNTERGDRGRRILKVCFLCLTSAHFCRDLQQVLQKSARLATRPLTSRIRDQTKDHSRGHITTRSCHCHWLDINECFFMFHFHNKIISFHNFHVYLVCLLFFITGNKSCKPVSMFSGVHCCANSRNYIIDKFCKFLCASLRCCCNVKCW